MQKETKERRVEAIRFRLWSVHKLHPQEIYNSLLELITLQEIDEFIPMMRECIKASKYDPHLGRYIHLFDILLNHYTFNQLLHNCLVEFYSKIVRHLNMQKLWPDIEQAMVMRKYWVGRIHYRMYDELRTQTYRLTCIDIDNILSVEAIEQIRYYYVHSLRLSHQQLFYFLPQLHHLHPGYYHNPSFLMHPNDSFPHTQLLPNDTKSKLLSPTVSESSQVIGAKCMQQSDAFNMITNPHVNTNVKNNCYYKLPNQEQKFDFAKRTRQESEETNVGDHVGGLRKCITSNTHILSSYKAGKAENKNKVIKPEFKQLSPVQHKHQQSPKKQAIEPSKKEQSKVQREKTKGELQAIQMMAKLRSLNPHECRECGISFITEDNKKKHSSEHVKSKLRQLDIAEAKKFGSIKNYDNNKFKTAAAWINLADQQEDKPCHIVNPNDFIQVLPQQVSKPQKPQETEQEQVKQTELGTSEQTQIEQLPLLVRKQHICPLCCMAFDQTILNEDWIYKDALRVVFVTPNTTPAQARENQTLMHRSCCKILRQVQNNPNRCAVSVH